jgi:hypothetical protein
MERVLLAPFKNDGVQPCLQENNSLISNTVMTWSVIKNERGGLAYQ